MSRAPVADATTLLAWLDTSAGHHAEYSDGLSNHLPMATQALHRLGAAPQRLHAWAEAYATRLQPAPPAQDWPSGDAWAAYLGRRDAWPMYRSLFSQWLGQEGAGDVLEAVLPRLIDGCAGAAFHGLIRTAYAVQAAHRQELADALAHWASTWLAALPPVSALCGLPGSTGAFAEGSRCQRPGSRASPRGSRRSADRICASKRTAGASDG